MYYLIKRCLIKFMN